MNDGITKIVGLKNSGISRTLQIVLCDNIRMIKAFMAR